MKIIKVGKDEKSIDGKYLPYNFDTFISDISDADRIICITDDPALLKQVALVVRTSGKQFTYIGDCDPEYILRKIPGVETFKSAQESPYVMKSAPKTKPEVEDEKSTLF